jgi:hypothetical protein
MKTALANIQAVALILLLVPSAFGQSQKSDYSIHGTVRNTVTGEPVKNALVSLEGTPTDPSNSSPDRESGKPQTKVMLSGTTGEFHFDGLSEGQYIYSVQKWGFTGDEGFSSSGNFVFPRTPSDAAIEVALTPLGAIEGKVVNQYDEPLEKVLLDVYGLAIRYGEKSVTKFGTVWTDDRGLFRLTDLQAGKYLVKAQGLGGGTETHFGIYELRYAPWEAFSPVYFGGAADIDSATPIWVAAGSRVQANFRLEVQPSFKVKGKLERYIASEAVTFELLRGDDQSEASRAVLDVGTGNFEILDVTPGVYRLRAEQKTTRGEVMVSVGAEDVKGVSIVLSPPVTLTALIHSPAPLRNGAAPCEVFLHERGDPNALYSPRAQGSGRFIVDLFAGQYQVRVGCFEGYPLSASFGGTDLLANPVITIQPGVIPPPIEVEHQPGGGTLKVKFAKQAPPAGAVLLVPAFSVLAGPLLRATAMSAAAPSDDIIFPNLAPGDYSVYGLSRFEGVEYQSPTFLQALKEGAGVHIEDGKTTEVAIASISQ